jgi:DNA-binding NtrC family response regulator
MVLRAIAACGGNRVDAARKLGITPRTLQYHITKAGLSRRRSIKKTAAMFTDIVPTAAVG